MKFLLLLIILFVSGIALGYYLSSQGTQSKVPPTVVQENPTRWNGETPTWKPHLPAQSQWVSWTTMMSDTGIVVNSGQLLSLERTARYDFLKKVEISLEWEKNKKEVSDIEALVAGDCDAVSPENQNFCRSYVSKAISASLTEVEKTLLNALIMGDRKLCLGNPEIEAIFDRVMIIKEKKKPDFPVSLFESDQDFYEFYRNSTRDEYLAKLELLYLSGK